MPLPPLTTERRNELAKLAGKYAEAARVSVRGVRRDGMETLKKHEKDGAISQDLQRDWSDAVQKLTDGYIKRIDESLAAKAHEFDRVLKIGRTHLQDATPVRLGQVFSGFAQQIQNGAVRLQHAMPHLCELALGGTAVGTGINCPKGFPKKAIARIAGCSVSALPAVSPSP